MEKAVEVKNIVKIIKGQALETTLVNDISFSINKGEFVSIIGPSGSGKSSLMYLLGLLDSPTQGEVMIDGVDTTKASEEEKEKIRLEKIGFIFQFHFLLDEFTVLENVLLPMKKLGKLSEEEMIKKGHELLNHFGLVEENIVHKYPWQLSGGQKQRVAVARSMANDPMIILADEPTGNLDSKNAAIVFNLFNDLVRKEGKTVITITHDTDLAEKTQRKIKIIDGKLAKI